MKKTFFVLLLLLVCPVLLSAQELKTAEGFIFEIGEVEFGDWNKARHHLANDWVERKDSEQELSYIAIAYKLTNSNETRKVDLSENLRFELIDEYGNRYRQMRKPANYVKPVLAVSKNFPSIYPGESYGETIFFESPVDRAQTLKLLIDAKALGVPEKVELVTELPGRPVGRLAEKEQEPPKAKEVKEKPKPSAGIVISAPPNQSVYEQGELVHLKVKVNEKRLPDYLVISAFDFTFEDASPGSDNVYDLNIPHEWTAGPSSVSVIAVWGSSSDGVTKSDDIIINISSASTLGIF